MSQDYTVDLYEPSHVANTDLENTEKNFEALRTSFSGAAQPANMIAGMFWYDTTNHILKQRNEANSAWLDIYDLANDRVYDSEKLAGVAANVYVQNSRQVIAGTGLDGGGTLAANRTINHTAHTGDVTGATALTIGASKISQSMLKTAEEVETSSDSTVAPDNCGASGHAVFASAGIYGLNLQHKYAKTAGDGTISNFSITLNYASNWASSTSYQSPMRYTWEATFTVFGGTCTSYLKRRYVTSSGEYHWIFILRDKTTKFIKRLRSSPDHPCFGDGNPDRVPHPWVDMYDPKIHEIIVCPLTINEVEVMLKAESKDSERDVAEIITEDYEVDEESKCKFPTKPVTVGLPKVIKIKGKDTLVDWRFMPPGTKVTPIKKVITQPKDVLCKKLRLKRSK